MALALGIFQRENLQLGPSKTATAFPRPTTARAMSIPYLGNNPLLPVIKTGIIRVFG
ncbi:MAG: hypothetical protein MKZ70_02305 [Opitutales bacterium]|nr:hypothetical protein [Opitutales bacterium]